MSEIPAQPDIPSLIAALKDEDSFARWSAARALGQLGEIAAEAVPALAETLHATDGFVRHTAAEALGQIGAPSVTALIKALKDEHAYVRLEAARALGLMGASAAEAIPTLIDVLGHADNTMRWEIVEALKRVGATAVPALVETMRDERIFIRQAAAEILASIAVPDPRVISVLEAALEDTDGVVRVNAALGLQRLLAHPAALPACIAALKGNDRDARLRAKYAYWNFGEIAVPVLLELLQDSDNEVRWAAVSVLGRIGAPAAGAVSALAAALKDESQVVREAAVMALAIIGVPPPANAVPALKEILRGADWLLSRRVFEVLERIDTPESHRD
jgi:HEAT repeat protein